jgi:SAM-dependent methyltransferase
MQIERKNDFLLCSNCNIEFPIIFNKIPTLFANPLQKLTGSLFSCWEYLDEQRSLSRVFKNVEPNLRAQRALDSFDTALRCNKSIFEGIENELRKYINLDQIKDSLITNQPPVGREPYSFNFSYLARDWTNDEKARNEIRQITENLSEIFAQSNFKRTLFVGAGTGRLAYELGKWGSEIYAVDNEVLMAYLFEAVKRSDIKFGDLGLRNQESFEQIELKVASTKGFNLNVLGNINYLLADVQHLPFEDNFFDAIVSIYFTDVLPLQNFIPEIKRVLKHEKGVFIHYGPLEYHFNSKEMMLSFNEVKNLFELSGFEIQNTSRKSYGHCVNDSSYKVFPNWHFIWDK